MAGEIPPVAQIIAMKVWLVGAFLYAVTSVASAAIAFDHSIWDDLLKAHVSEVDQGASTAVDYRAMTRDQDRLEQYLRQMATVEQTQFDQWSKAQQLAFLINAYNAWTVELILSKYPDLESIRDLGSLFRSPWKKKFVDILGQRRSLDEIEHELIRGSSRYRDARVHFALNCASVGCPALRAEAYTAAELTTQLEQQTVQFLGDRSRNRYQAGELQVSSIFDWYGEDFTKGWQGVNSLRDFFAKHHSELRLSPAQLKELQSGAMPVEFLDYDWSLNAKR